MEQKAADSNWVPRKKNFFFYPSLIRVARGSVWNSQSQVSGGFFGHEDCVGAWLDTSPGNGWPFKIFTMLSLFVGKCQFLLQWEACTANRGSWMLAIGSTCSKFLVSLVVRGNHCLLSFFFSGLCCFRLDLIKTWFGACNVHSLQNILFIHQVLSCM